MSIREREIETGSVNLRDKFYLVQKLFQEGKQIVFNEVDYSRHSIFVSSEMLSRLGSSVAIEWLIQEAFNAVLNVHDKAKTRFEPGRSLRLDHGQEVWRFAILYPEKTHTPLAKTRKTFLQAINEKITA